MGAPRSTAFVAGLAALVGACGDASESTESVLAAPPTLGPGDSVFEHLDQLQLLAWSESNLPAELAAPARAVLAARSWRVEATDWQTDPRAPAPDELRGLPSVGSSARRWSCRPPLRVDLGLGAPWLRHQGRVAVRKRPSQLRQDHTTQHLIWGDAEAHQAFRFDAERGELEAFGPRPPGVVEFGYEPAPDGHLARLEALRQPTSAELVCRADLGKVDRRCLFAPAPTILELPVAGWQGDALDVAVGVPDVGFALLGDQLVRADGQSDGVTFALDVLVESGADGPRVQRVWSRHVRPTDGFVEQRVDLSAVAHGLRALRLVTEPGPDGDARCDYALWSGLRVVGAPRQAPERPHVFLLDIDTLRADRLGCYGAVRDTSPRIDAWAAEQAVVFEDSLATSNWTLPSTASLVTGLSVTQHGVREFPDALGLTDEPLAERLAAAGYETLGRTDGGFVAPSFGFARGFERYDYEFLSPGQHQKQRWTREIERLRQRRSERPVFFFLQTYHVHAPYQPDDRYADVDAPYDGPYRDARVTKQSLTAARRRGEVMPREADWQHLNALYDAGVRRMDDVVGEFLEALAELYADEPYVVVLTSDHGDEIGDHGLFGHGHSLYQELLEVPLLIRYPRGERVGRSTHPVSGLDVVPTILALVGLDVPTHLPGLPLLGSEPARRLRVAEHADTAFAVHLDGFKLIQGEISAYEEVSQVRLLSRHLDDPLDERDLVGLEPERLTGLDALLREHLEQYGSRKDAADAAPTVDPGLIAELQALGYLGG